MVTLKDNQVLDLTKGEKVYERESKKMLESTSTPAEAEVQESLPCDYMLEIAKQESEQQWDEQSQKQAPLFFSLMDEYSTLLPNPDMPRDPIDYCVSPFHQVHIPVVPITPSWVNNPEPKELIVKKDKVQQVLDAINARLETFASLDGSLEEINGQVTALKWVKKILTSE